MLTKYQNIKLLLMLSMLLCMGGLIVSSASAQEAQIAPSVSANGQAVDEVKKNSHGSHLDVKMDEIQHVIALQEERTGDRIKELEDVIAVQRNIINELRVDLKSIADKPLTNGTTFEIWTGILLACVAIIVTVLGVVVAVLAFFGYKNTTIMSEKIAKDTASEIANKLAPEVAERRFREHVKDGGFNEIIEEAVDKIAFSNINDPENYPEGNS